MGFRFRRSVKIMPGVKLNFSKRGVSTTLGVKGARYTMGSGGRRTASVGIPGTGISYVATRNKHTARKVSQNTVGYCSKTTTLILCLMFGLLGVHRFYVGKKGTGILWLFSAGGFIIGWIIDVLAILNGSFTDSVGRPLQ